MNDQPRCESCRYFNDHTGETTGECRLNPPGTGETRFLGVHVRGVWPEVLPDDWCGQHRVQPDVYHTETRTDPHPFERVPGEIFCGICGGAPGASWHNA